jgi:hypothetical protein
VKQEQDIGNKRKDREIEKWMGREAKSQMGMEVEEWIDRETDE